MNRRDCQSFRSAVWAFRAVLLLAALSFGAVVSADAAAFEAWVQRYGGQFYSGSPQALAVDGEGDVIVTGSAYIATNGTTSLGYYTAKYSARYGALVWEQRYNGPLENRNDVTAAVGVDSSGNVIVTGTAGNSSGNSDFYTVKYAGTNGALIWEKRYSSPGISDDGAWALVVDGNDDVVVTGRSVASSNTVKYAGADGAVLWEQRFNGQVSAGAIGRVQSMAVDRNGDVAISGYSSTNRYSDFHTAKFSGQDGTLLWEKIYDGPANRADWVQAVGVDDAGNVVVTGYSNNGGDSTGDFYTAKYAAGDGTLVWERRYPTGRASSLAVDASGDVVVTGAAGNGYYTAKYAAVDGAILWEKSYNGPANGVDGAVAMAMDESGNVVVTGYSSSIGYADNLDYYTVKYAAGDGAMIWEKRYDGPFNGQDEPLTANSLALGRNGMVFVTGTSIMDMYGSKGFATVAYREVLNPVSLEMDSSGVRLRFTGTPGVTYSIERAPAPSGSWDIIENLVMPAGGLTEYIDTNPPHGTSYYRTSAR